MKTSRVKGYPRLYREELGKEGTRFRIVIHRNKKLTQEYFFFGAKKSEEDAFASAIKRWTEIRKSFPVITRREFAQIERRKSATGIVGVRRVTKTTKGFEYDFWVAWWSDRRHNRKSRGFSVNKYGEEEAKKLAIKARQDSLAELADS
jgi:hypothetical protein